jgi:hypothetical protein
MLVLIRSFVVTSSGSEKRCLKYSIFSFSDCFVGKAWVLLFAFY